MRPSHVTGFPLSPLCALLALALGPAASHAQAPAAASNRPLYAQRAQPAEPEAPLRVNISEQLLNLDVRINGAPRGRWALLDRNGVFYAPQEAFEAWQLKRRVNAESVEFRGQIYFPLAAVPGFEARINFAQRSANLSFAAAASTAPAPTPPIAAAPAPLVAAPATPPAAIAAAPAPAPRPPSAPATSPPPAPLAAPVAPAPPPAAPVPAQAAAPTPPRATAASPAPAAAATPSPNGERFLPLEVSINNAPSGQWTLLEKDGVLYAPEEAFDEWRINRRGSAQPVEVRGRVWYPLTSIPGFTSRLNFANQSVDLVFAPSAFSATKLATEREARPALSPVLPALFLNYDLSFDASANRGGSGARSLGALTEIGYSNDWGVLISSFAARNIGTGDPALKANVQRLETTFSRDFPSSNLTLRLGDATSRSGTLGRSVFFGGVQLGTNFSLTPGFVTQAIPVIRGTSSAPSTVELYINDALRQTSSVPTGPFAIDNFPLLTGSGQARVVVRDLLGRETVLVQPFFTSNELLEENLTDFSVEAGAIRRNLGTSSNDYGEPFVSGTVRYGVTKNLTLEGHTELSKDTRGASLGVSYALPFAVLGQAALGVSNDSTSGGGVQYLLGVEKTGLRHGFTARAEGASRDYRQIGLDSTALPQKRQYSASYSYASENFGALGLGAARVETYDGNPVTSLTANYSFRLGQRSSLTLSATRVLGNTSGTSVGLSFVMPLDGQLNVSSSLTSRSGQTDAFASVSKGLTSETGIGWRALAGVRQGEAYSEAGVLRQGNKSLLTADISASKDSQNIRLGAQGGLVLAGGNLFASRRVQDSFALVEVPGYPNVGVGFQGSNLTRTNEDGVALLPRLLPYQNNSIQLNPNELPINAELDSIEQVVVPAGRSGVRVTFPVRSGRAALIKLVFADGEPAPAGAELELVGDKKEFFVARRGEAFITGMQKQNTLKLKWKGASCTISVTLDDVKSEEIARLGPLTCSGVAR
ncbi:MAG: fimbria/pilus outer membrane usher protein [Burkholderiaceae bacterium]